MPLYITRMRTNHFGMADSGWPGCAKSLKGVILDLCGVLYDSGEGDGVAIPGSIESVKKWVKILRRNLISFTSSVWIAVKVRHSDLMMYVTTCFALLTYWKAQGIRPAAAILHQWDPGHQREVCSQASKIGLWHLCIWSLPSCACSHSCSQRKRFTSSLAGAWW